MVQIVGFPDADRVLIERAVDEVWRRLRTADVPEPLRLQLLALFDKGGKSSKFAICLCDIETPCSPKDTIVIGTYEQSRRHGGDSQKGDASPKDTLSNFELIFSQIDGFEDAHLQAVLRVGRCHVIVPQQAIPTETSVECP